MRIARLLGGTALAALAALAVASPAAADNAALPINPDHVPKKAANFQGGDQCTAPFDNLDENVDGWHFVLPSQGSFLSLTLTFGTPDGDVTAVVDDMKDNPSSGPGWSGYLDNAGLTDKHAYVFTDAGWELTAATASVTGEGGQNFFNLSHTCAGTPTEPTPSASPSEPGEESPSPSPSSSTPGGGDGGGDLPKTGVSLGGFAAAGVALLAGGVGLLAVRRRRHIAES